MNIKATTRVCGLIGNPVEHSVSPVIHNKLATDLDIDMVYTTFRVESEEVAAAVKGAHALNILGLNVTVPHKQAVIDSLADIDELARAIGAVNTLVSCEGGYKGYNTDILGLERELKEEGISLEAKPVVIIGAGGAARAIAFMCARNKASEIYILNRTVEKAVDIAEAVNSFFGCDIAKGADIAMAANMPVKGYVAIQTTSVGLYPNCQEVPVTAESFYAEAEAGVDIIYNPFVTEFMKRMKAQGKPAYNGLKMLLYQGVAAFELWNSCSISDEESAKVYMAMKEAMGIHE